MPLFKWMQERELIRQRRARGEPAPWSQDRIMNAGHFTNVMREYDRVSVWVYQNITLPPAPPGILPLRLAVARWINNTETLEWIIQNDLMPVDGEFAELKELADALLEKEERGERVWGNGYVISAAGMQHRYYPSKIHYALEGCVAQMLTLRDPLPQTIQGTTEALAALDGWGGFMAYEVACDLRWARGYLYDAPDIYTWANPGPGAVRGLRGLGFTAGRYSVENMRNILFRATNVLWAVEWPRALEMRDIEHSLCEWGKYRKMEATGAPPRRYYRPFAGPLSHRV